MGFIPILLTLSAAIILFIMAVHNAMKSKKSQIENLAELMVKGLQGFSDNQISNDNTSSEDLSKIFQSVKKGVKSNDETRFDLEVRKPYQQMKLLKSQYNQLLAKKPYSYVAQIMGHRPM